jgi:Fe-S-cluster containining protein
VTLADRRRFARHFGIPTAAFTRRYCTKTEGHFHLKESSGDCRFLKGRRCGVYEARPTQCRTWPFWKSLRGVRAWNREVVAFCPGVGKGRWHSPDEIRAQLAQDS